MKYEELLKKAAPAVRQVARMGVWDGVSVDVENGEPVVLAILRKFPIVQFFHKVKLIKTPELPERIEGIRCKVIFQSPPTKVR